MYRYNYTLTYIQNNEWKILTTLSNLKNKNLSHFKEYRTLLSIKASLTQI